MVDAVRPLMQRSARDGHRTAERHVYNRAGRPCPRCGTPIRGADAGRRQPPDYWCPVQLASVNVGRWSHG